MRKFEDKPQGVSEARALLAEARLLLSDAARPSPPRPPSPTVDVPAPRDAAAHELQRLLDLKNGFGELSLADEAKLRQLQSSTGSQKLKAKQRDHVGKELRSTSTTAVAAGAAAEALQTAVVGAQDHSAHERSIAQMPAAEDADQSLDLDDGQEEQESATLSENPYTLTFGKRSGRSLGSCILPSDHLILGKKFNQSLEHVNLPSSLRSLTFGYWYDQSLEGVHLPNTLESIAFGGQYNQSLENVVLPSSLVNLTFGLEYNQSLQQVTLPSGLQNLTFGDRYNQSLDNVTLPRSIVSLVFGVDFNQSLENVTLPRSLRNLTFGDWFNQNLALVKLPRGIQSLTFGHRYNHADPKTN